MSDKEKQPSQQKVVESPERGGEGYYIGFNEVNKIIDESNLLSPQKKELKETMLQALVEVDVSSKEELEYLGRNFDSLIHNLCEVLPLDDSDRKALEEMANWSKNPEEAIDLINEGLEKSQTIEEKFDFLMTRLPDKLFLDKEDQEKVINWREDPGEAAEIIDDRLEELLKERVAEEDVRELVRTIFNGFLNISLSELSQDELHRLGSEICRVIPKFDIFKVTRPEVPFKEKE